MILQQAALRKVLQLFGSDARLQQSLIRGDIRQSLLPSSDVDGGGDFYTAFWADAKAHAAGRLDLKEATAQRILDHRGRRRLYPLLQDGFLSLLRESRRLRNEPYQITNQSPKGRFTVGPRNSIIKIENTLHIRINEDADRIIYPYFSERPTLGSDEARLGLWAMAQALSPRHIEEMRLVDIVRGARFSVHTNPLQGNEEDLFLSRHDEICRLWEALREEY